MWAGYRCAPLRSRQASAAMRRLRFQVVANGKVVSFHPSLARAQETAEALMPQRRDLHIIAIPAAASRPSQRWRYDYAQREWVQT